MLDIPLSEWPDGAEWATVDYSGDLEFWEEQPFIDGVFWNHGLDFIKEVKRFKSYSWPHWRDSLTPRPKDENGVWVKDGDYAPDGYSVNATEVGDPPNWRWIIKGLSDAINHPPHYTHGDIECIDAILAALGKQGAADYCRGAVIKYAWRCMNKGTPSQDMEKAAWYARKAAELLKDETA